MKRLRFYAFAATLVFCWAGITSAAWAQPSTDDRAQELHEEGRKLLDQGEAAAACDKFSRSLALRENMSTRFRFGQCSEKLERLATAWKSYDAVAQLARKANKPKRAQYAQDAADKIRARVPLLTILLAKQTAKTSTITITISNARGAPTRLAESDWNKPRLVDGGAYKVRVTAPGYELWSKTIQIRNENHKAELQVPLLKQQSKPASTTEPIGTEPTSPPLPPKPAPLGGDPQESTGATEAGRATALSTGERAGTNPQEIAGYSIMALGIGAVGGGVALALIGEGRYASSNEAGRCQADICSQEGLDLRAQARREALAGVVLWPAGLALAATGLALGITADDEGMEEAVAKVRVSVGPTSLSVSGVW